SSVACSKLDAAIWREVCKVVFEPNTLIADMERELQSGKNAEILGQIDYLDKELAGLNKEDAFLWKSFVAEEFNEVEYKDRRDALKERRAKLTEKRAKLASEVITEEQIAQRRAYLLGLALQVRAAGYEPDTIEFSERQRLIKRYVDRITLDARSETFRMEGIVSGEFALLSKDRKGGIYFPYNGNDPNATDEEKAGLIGYPPPGWDESIPYIPAYWDVPQVC